MSLAPTDRENYRWLETARSYIGLRETPGPATNPIIGRWLKALGAWWSDDEMPWCGTFVAACLRESGLGYPKQWYRARAYLEYGMPLATPTYGSIVVFERGAGGHVGFVVGRDASGRIVTLSGNQGDAVSVSPFDQKRVLGYRWPAFPNGTPAVLVLRSMPIVATRGASSTREV